MSLSGRGVTRRVRQLLSGDLPAHQHRLAILAVAMTTLVLALGAALPSAVLAGADRPAQVSTVRHCPN